MNRRANGGPNLQELVHCATEWDQPADLERGAVYGPNGPHAELYRELEIDLETADNNALDGVARRLDDDIFIKQLASLRPLTYQQRRAAAAAELRIGVGALDKLVRNSQAEAEKEEATLPHWQVEPSHRPVDGAGLLDRIREVFFRHIVLPRGAEFALPLWVLHVWTMNASDISPFLVLVSPTKRCGKTSVLIILLYLTPRSELASNISPSALFRYIQEARPTLLIDEAETFVKDNEEMRGILNSGHTKAAAHVIRNVEVNGEYRPRRFSTWAPKAIATIRVLADTIEDRSIIIQLQRKPKSATVARLRKRDNDEFASLRSQAARWAADNFSKLTDPNPSIPEVLNDRAADNWRPLLAIADLAGGAWPQRAREAACILSGEEHDMSSVNVELLAHIRHAFDGTDALTSADLVAALIADPEQPWAEWKHGKPLTQNQLARLLRPFGICSETVHPPGRPHAKGYKRGSFEDAWASYLPRQNTSSAADGASEACKRATADETRTSDPFQSVRQRDPHGSKEAEFSNSHAGLPGCTDLKSTHRRCDHCGQVGATGRWDWPGRPDGIWLHSRCEEAWFDSEGTDSR